MPQDRLTRHELSWLLAQEARGAAQALREGVTQLKVPGPISEPRIESAAPVETNLDALEDAINMLSALNSGGRGKARRGRIDLAALLYEVAPKARIALEPGAGTEVFGDESDMRRMLHLLVTQADSGMSAQAGPAEVHIRRQTDWVKISVDLGPDTAAAAELERRWLSRMATRYGGWVELDGGTQSIYLPADGASDQREVVELRKELEQAQQLGEVYARELAAVVASGDTRSELPRAEHASGAAERLELLQNTASSLQRAFKHWLDGLRAELAELATPLGEGSPIVQGLGKRLTSGAELLSDLAVIGECRLNEALQRVELEKVVEEVLHAVRPRALRHDVTIEIALPGRIQLETRPAELRSLLRSLLHHALSATPRAAKVRVSAVQTEMGVLIGVEDGGPMIPEASRADVVHHRTDPTAFGRPAGVSLLVASVLAEALGGSLGIREGVGAEASSPSRDSSSAPGRTEVWVLLPSRRT